MEEEEEEEEEDNDDDDDDGGGGEGVGINVHKKADTPNELHAGIFDAAVRIKKREDQLRRTACDLHTRVSDFIEVDVGIFEH